MWGKIGGDPLNGVGVGVKQVIAGLSDAVADGLMKFLHRHHKPARSFLVDTMMQTLNEFHMPRGSGRYYLEYIQGLVLAIGVTTEGSIVQLQGSDDAVIDRVAFRLPTNPGAGLTVDLMINQNAVTGYDGLTVPLVGGGTMNWQVWHHVDVYVSAGSRMWWAFNNMAGIAGVADSGIRARRVPPAQGPTRR